MKVVSRKEALALGSLTYFSGKPCPRGHVGPRYVSSHACKACAQQKRDEWAAANPVKVKELTAKSRAKHAEKIKARERSRSVARRASQPELVRQRVRNAQARACLQLKDRYVVGLVVQGSKIPRQDVTKELIDMKREQLRLQRLMRDFKQAIQQRTEHEEQ